MLWRTAMPLRAQVQPRLSSILRGVLFRLSSPPCLSRRSFSSFDFENPTGAQGEIHLHPSTNLSIDTSGLSNPSGLYNGSRASDSDLIRHIKGIIKFRGGPISVAEYMEEVLTNPKSGYYINRDVFGKGGDFVTSPEVSQMFGEMIGIWAVCLWESMGRPRAVNLIELGPGRGTLMADLFRGISKFKDFRESLNVHLIECSPRLRKLQHETLNCEGDSDGVAVNKSVSSLAGVHVSWHTVLEQVPTGLPTIVVSHEFYDALPVHQFQKTSRGWREKMVDVGDDESLFRFVLSPHPTPASVFLMKRLRWDDGDDRIPKLNHAEISPKAMELTESICRRIGRDGGAALVIDYGVDGLVSDTLQAVRKHQFVGVLDEPGSADLSAHVDFAGIRHVAGEASSEDVGVHGPMTQRDFLISLGIECRLKALVERCTDDKQAESLRSGYRRLLGDGEDDGGMGMRYLAMVLSNRNHGTPIPFYGSM